MDVFSGPKADSLKDVLAGEYDVVIPINGRLQSLKFSLGRMIGRYKLLITGHSGIGRDDIWNIMVKPNVFIALTKHMASWAKKWAFGTKIVTIPNGIDLNKFTPFGSKISVDLQKPIILSVGALVWYKHHERVIKAVGKLGFGSVLIVGSGDQKNSLEEIGKEVLGDRFKIMSFKYQDIPKVYRSVDLFTLPSWNREAFGIVYLEALATGLGVIAPNDLSRKEIVGDAGILVDTSDPIKYAKAIEECLKTDWKDKPFHQAEKFSWQEVTQQYEDLLLSLL